MVMMMAIKYKYLNVNVHHCRSSWYGSGVIRRRNHAGRGFGECERIYSSMTDSTHVRVRSWLCQDI